MAFLPFFSSIVFVHFISQFHVQIQTMFNENDSHGSVLRFHASEIGLDLCNKNSKSNSSWATGHCIVVVHNNDRSFLTHRGCMEHFEPSVIDVKALKNRAKQRQHHIHIAGYYNLTHFWNGRLKQALVEMSTPTTTVSLVPQYDATHEWDGGLLDLLPLIDVLFVSQGEAAGITKYPVVSQEDNNSLIQHASMIFARASPDTLIVLTLGSKGAVAIRNGQVLARQSAATLAGPVLDPTGAGDAFTAGFLASLMLQKSQNPNLDCEFDSRKALKLGCALGAACVMKKGASTSLSMQEIQDCLETL